MVVKDLGTMASPPVTNSHVASKDSATLHRHLDSKFLSLEKAEGGFLILEDGRRIRDASGGASVGCIGWGNERVAKAVASQVLAAPYCATIFYTTKVCEELCQFLVAGTGGKMARAYIVNSGKLRWQLR
jgi:adenosylmethionine-8-amino-7-oxononanoate aminotransferase